MTITSSAGAAPPAQASLAALRRSLRRRGRVVVAFSGGADSALVARVAHDTLGRTSVLCATALSPSLAAGEEEYCRSLAAEWGLRWTGVPTREMEDPAYVANGADRCARCKTALMDALAPLAAAEGATILLGVNVSDLGDHRPGQAAAAAGGAVFPLVEAGFTKADVRNWSRRIGLRTWDKPAAACLASRLPYGTPVTLGRLSAVDTAESALRALGFSQLRVRHHGDAARLEVEPTLLAEVVDRRAEVVSAVRSAGFTFVALDLEGFRSGSLNRALGRDVLVGPDAEHLVQADNETEGVDGVTEDPAEGGGTP
jgi:pyridinium-3,5-biscarboxylic acid mononucleotide sulfurtransferase